MGVIQHFIPFFVPFCQNETPLYFSKVAFQRHETPLQENKA
jgi:hypothetical protein